MRTIFLALALVLAAPALAADAAAPATTDVDYSKLPAEAQDCAGCHQQDGKGDGPAVSHLAAFAASVHGQAGISCKDCHQGYAMGPHDGEVKLSADEAALVERLSRATWGEGDKKERLSSPRALLACQNCHEGPAAAYQKSIHARFLAGDAKVAGPTCLSCHGSVHAIARKLEPYAPKATARVAVPADRRELQKACEKCHGNEEYSKAAGLSTEVKSAYHDSIHGRLVRVGNAVAPTCVSCHAGDAASGGSHGIVAKAEAASAVSAERRKDTCGRCHEGANDNFAGLIAHKQIQETGHHLVPHVTHVAFSYLTTLTLVFFAFHVLIDFIYELRQRLAAKSHGHSADALRSVVRFDIHQRAQHWFMLSGVILLGLTGWPLRGAGDAQAAEYSRSFLRVFGGAEGAALWHRIGAVLIIISSAYHLFYLTFLAARKRLPFSMVPVPKDALDMRDNILFMLGVKKERPRFDRYMYLEKFDYWAVFWGIIMMVGTGFVFWFPVFFAKYAPAWLLTAAQIIHGEEATLAITFLFVVHFYNVHLKPSIFPMNWAWINGRISVEMLKHEHPEEYDRIKDKIE